MTENTARVCPICKFNDSRIILEKLGILKLKVKCPRCKEFVILDSVAFEEPDPKLRYKVSAWIRNHNEQSGEVPQITPETINDLQIHLPTYSPRDKQVILLKNIERETKYPGQRVELTYSYDFPLAWATGQEEFLYYITSLRDRGLISADLAMGQCDVTITAAGWDYLEKQDRLTEERTQVFVAMSFSDDMKPIYDGPIYKAIEKAGYKPYRVDVEPHSDRIDVKIMAEIKNSRFLVADFTGQKHGVYFEAGYALGLGLPVIWCVKKDELEKAHFDTRQYNHIAWATMEDLEDQLFNFICAIIGKGKVI